MTQKEQKSEMKMLFSEEFVIKQLKPSDDIKCI